MGGEGVHKCVNMGGEGVHKCVNMGGEGVHKCVNMGGEGVHKCVYMSGGRGFTNKYIMYAACSICHFSDRMYNFSLIPSPIFK